MLQFFRKYQTYFFAVITVVIVISFSFFGTYNTLPADSIHEQVAFTAVDGTAVKRKELESMALFIGTDNEDKRIYGGIWGPNFLNDGVIRQDFFSTGLASLIVQAYPESVSADLEMRLEKEKRYVPYTHPQAPFVSVEGAWEYFSPKMKKNFNALRRSESAASPDAFSTRVALFLQQKQLSPSLLRQLLRYQEKQYQWLKPDPNLDRQDLSLFGYHSIEDWFGPRFVRLIAEFIINSAKIAEKKGYEVTKAEAWAELLQNADVSFQQNMGNPHLGVKSSAEYLNEQLRRMGMDSHMAIAAWRQVLLSRRMFQDIGNAVFVDALMHQKFFDFAKEMVKGELYRLPAALRFANYATLQKLETYLHAVAKPGKDVLALPQSYFTAAEVKKTHPELVQRRYLLRVAQINKEELEAKVPLREIWKWELEESHWNTLKQEFPTLALAAAPTREMRLTALDALDEITRSRVDALAREAIVAEHPETLHSALDRAEPKEMNVGIRLKGGKSFFGLEDRSQLLQLLDQAPLGDVATEALAFFSPDKKNYYKIAVLQRSPHEEVLTFAEANQENILDKLVDNELQAYYVKIRDSSPSKFQKEDKSWKEFADVKTEVADLYFDKILKAIKKDYATTHKEGPQPNTGDLAAPLRFYAYARHVQTELQKNPSNAAAYIAVQKENQEGKEALPAEKLLIDQWKWERTPYETNRSSSSDLFNIDDLLLLAPEQWSAIKTPVNGDIVFFKLGNKVPNGDVTAMYNKIHLVHGELSDDAQRTFMQSVLRELKEKAAISLSYLDANSSTMEPEIENEKS
jgi:GcvH upstream region-like protein